jgi:hypothetical protein
LAGYTRCLIVLDCGSQGHFVLIKKPDWLNEEILSPII